MYTFNELVKIMRKEQGLSQKNLASLSNLDRTTISKIEGDNNYSPTLDTAERISKALGIELGTMLNLRSYYNNVGL